MLAYQLHLPQTPTEGMPLLVMLHGRGADESDMLGLAGFFSGVLFAAPRAPYPAAPWGYGPGFAWYRFLGGVRPDPVHFQHSLDELDAFLTNLAADLPVQPGPLVLGGFSQGGTMSLAFALNHPRKVHTVLNLSGFLAEHPAVVVSPETAANARVYWPHGLQDPAIPHANARQGRSTLQSAGAYVVAPDYDMGHTIIRQEVDDINALLRDL